MADVATCSDYIVSKGAYIKVGNAPTTTPFTKTNLAAAATLEVGMVESIGEFGPESSVGSYTPLGTGIACKYLGTTDNGEIALTIAKTTTDSGLAKLIEKQGDQLGVAVKITLSDDTTYVFHGLVKSAKVSVGSGEDVVKITTSLVINGSVYETAPV